MTDLIYRSVTELRGDLQAKRVSARELLDALIARNDALHAKLNIVVAKDLDRARRDAAAIDEARAQGQSLGPLAGIPMTIKDGFDVENMPAICGNPNYVSRAKTCEDAAVVASVRRAGAVIWGKTNVPIHLGDWQSYNAVYGATNNPFDVTRVPGGSSGGSAAALASGVTPLEIGSDIGGSLRTPAHYCGVYALKTTWGLLSGKGHVPPPPGYDGPDVDLGVYGPMTRTAADLRLLQGILQGTALRGPQSIKGRRVALWLDEPEFIASADTRAAVERARDVLRKQGADVRVGRPSVPIRDMMNAYQGILMPLVTGQPINTPAFNAAQATRDGFKKQLAAFFAEGWDAILAPVTPTPAFPHDHSEPMAARLLDVDGEKTSYLRNLEWIGLATSLHAPALSAPAGRTRAGLPVGVQVIGRWNEEAALLDYADALDEAFGFKPPGL